MAKINIMTDEEGNDIGYDIVRAPTDDPDDINRMRNLIFFGFDDTQIKYNGREGSDNQVDKMKFIQEKHKDK